MISILVVSHNHLCREMLASAKMIVGDDLPQVDYLELLPEDSSKSFVDKFHEKILELKTPDGILVLADLFGGSPCNACTMYCCRSMKATNDESQFACVSGANLGMLIEAVSSRDCMTLPELREACMESGRSGILDTVQRFFQA